jgi:hypothetical protein
MTSVDPQPPGSFGLLFKSRLESTINNYIQHARSLEDIKQLKDQIVADIIEILEDRPNCAFCGPKDPVRGVEVETVHLGNNSNARSVENFAPTTRCYYLRDVSLVFYWP